jgi:hypothetical protein
VAGDEDPTESLDIVCISPRHFVRGSRISSGEWRGSRAKKPLLTLMRYEASPVPASSPRTLNVVGMSMSLTKSSLRSRCWTWLDDASAGEAAVTPARFRAVLEGTDGAVMGGRVFVGPRGLMGVSGGIGRRRGWERGRSSNRGEHIVGLGSRR